MVISLKQDAYFLLPIAPSFSLAAYISSSKEKTTIYLFWDYPKLEFLFIYFEMSQSKMPTQKKNN